MILILTFLGLFAVMAFAPETPAGRFLRRGLVEGPARGLSRLTRGHLVLSVGIMIFAAAAIWLVDRELLAVMLTGAPEGIAYLAMFDVVTVVDALITASLLATSVRFRQVATFLRNMRPRARTPRARRTQRRIPANDDEDGRGYACAA